VAIGLQEDILRHLLGLLLHRDDAADEGMNRNGVRFDEPGECLDIALPDPADQLLFPLPFHFVPSSDWRSDISLDAKRRTALQR